MKVWADMVCVKCGGVVKDGELYTAKSVGSETHVSCLPKDQRQSVEDEYYKRLGKSPK